MEKRKELQVIVGFQPRWLARWGCHYKKLNFKCKRPGSGMEKEVCSEV